MKAAALDWDAIARTGDVRLAAAQLAPPFPAATVTRRARSRKLTLALLVAWLAWEAGGAVRVAIIGPRLLQATWGAVR